MSSTSSIHTTSKLLPALQHATSGSLGTVISTCALYPLSLVITRLQVQGQLLREGRIATAGREAGRTAEPSATARSNTRGDLTDPTSEAHAAYAAAATEAATAGAAANAAATRTSHRPPRHSQQHDSRNLKSTPSDYDGIADAFSKIYATEGGLRALYTGLGSDVAKSLLDSFLFFMFYEWFRSIRLAASYRRRRGKGGLGALEELAIGVAAGACSRALTTPIANVVTRKQTASMVAGADVEGRGIGDIARGIKSEKGAKGLWAGYSASLVLTLNPSITFFLQEFLRKKVISKKRAHNPGAFLTFLMAATSKAIASTITYPFQTAKTRLQTGISADADYEEDLIMLEDRDVDREVEGKLKTARAMRKAARRSIFGTLVHMARTEGVGSLYDGLRGEILKGFLSHGTTMVAKDVMHRLLFKLYFLMASMLSEFRLRRRSRSGRAKPTEMAMPMPEAMPIEKPLLIEEPALIEKPKLVEKLKPKPKPKPLEQPMMIEPARPMERPIPPQRPSFEHGPPREPTFEHGTPQRPAFEHSAVAHRPSSFEQQAPPQRPAFDPYRMPFEPRRMEDEASPGGMDRSVVLHSLPPALQYRMDPSEMGRRRRGHSVTRSMVIMNMLDKKHREFDK